MNKEFWLGGCDKFWNDESGFIISAELALVSTILVIGLVAGLTQLRDSVTMELSGVGAALSNLNQSYRVSPIMGQTSMTAGSQYVDVHTFQQSQGLQQSNPNNNSGFNEDLQTNNSFNGLKVANSPMVENNVYVTTKE